MEDSLRDARASSSQIAILINWPTPRTGIKEAAAFNCAQHLKKNKAAYMDQKGIDSAGSKGQESFLRAGPFYSSPSFPTTQTIYFIDIDFLYISDPNFLYHDHLYHI